MNMLGMGGLTGKEYLMAQTPRNTLLDSMSPEVAGAFQQQFGINPMLDPMATTTAAGAGAGAGNPMLALSALQGLLSPQQPQFMPMVQQQVTPGLNIPMSSMNQFYGGLL